MNKNELIERITKEFRKLNGRLNKDAKESVIRIQLAWENTDILDWLALQDETRKIYWSDRDKCCEVAGIGAAHHIFGEDIDDFSNLFNRLDSFLSNSDRHLRYYGGIRFNYRVKADNIWNNFHSFDFVIPEFEMLRIDTKNYIAANVLLKKGQSADEIIKTLKNKLSRLHFSKAVIHHTFPNLQKRSDIPDWNKWSEGIKRAYAMFDNKSLYKIVLARKTVLNFDGKINNIQLVKRLKKSNPNAFHFCFQQNDTLSFVGATPERLYKRDKRRIFTEAIAGTRPRGKTAEHDAFLKEDLLACEKDLREHRYVVDKIKNVLSENCVNMVSDKKVNIIENAQVQHLCYKMQGELKDGITDALLLRSIHPTPAVGGYPTEAALKKIDEMENFDRGWYAGPVGWVNHTAAEFAVALRSGLIYNNKLALFAGAGIVDGSKAADEWDEIDNKISNFMQILKSRSDAG